MTSNPAVITGTVADGWEAVRTAFAANFADNLTDPNTGDVGASVAIWHRGRPVVDLAGGFTDETRSSTYGPETLQVVFSTTKGITAIAVAMCVERGLLDYDQRVAHYWPEFAAHDKGAMTVAQLLSHQGGLFAPQGPLTLAEALDWATITERLANTAPEWPIGSAHGYHALTYGWLAGELIRRTDGRTPGAFVREEIAGPLKVDLFIGLPESLEPRVAPLLGRPISTENSDPQVKAMLEQFLGPDTKGGRALFLNGAFGGDGTFNRRDVHAAEVPAANGITNASALAKVYAATLAPVDGVQLFKSSVRDRARITVTPNGEPDQCLMMATTFGMGFMTHGAFTPYAGPGSYGHPGAGGSVAFAQPERELAFGYAMNKMASNLAGDPRAQRMIEAACSIIDSQK